MSDLTPNGFETQGHLDDRFNGRMNVEFPVPRFEGVSDIIGRTFAAYGENFSLIAKLALLLLLPPLLIEQAIINLALTNHGMGGLGTVQMTGGVVNFILTCLMTPALIYGMVVRMREGRSADVGECLSWGASKWLPTLGWGLVAGLLTSLGCALLIVPGLLAMTWFFMIYAVIAIEDGSRGDAMSRCIEVTRGYGWPVCGLVVLLTLLMMVLGFAVSIPHSMVEAAGVSTWPLVAAVEWLVELIWPLGVIGSVLMYLSIRSEERPTTCPHCSYPLIGNTSGYCPECGTPVPANAITDLPGA